MARKRYLKPGFFKNEELASLPPLVRILFQGLWCFADRDGRLEDRPLRLKSEIIPYDNLNVDTALNKLQDKNFIIRYKFSDGKNEQRFIQIIKFKDHQDVHINEQKSTIPAPVLHGASTVEEPFNNGSCTPLNLELNTLSTLNLEPCIVDDDNAQARKKQIDEAISFFTTDVPPNLDKEKNSAKKENIYPSLDEAIIALKDMAYWRIACEHNGISEENRVAFFKIFYEQNEDIYRIRLPSWLEIIKHFYNWIPIHQSKIKSENKDQNARKSTNGGKNTKRDELLNLNQQSTEFLSTITG